MSEKIKILVIDDQRIIGEFFNITLGAKGCEIVVVDDPLKAVEVVRQGSFNIIFLDIVMPGKDGIEILKEVKMLFPELPVVMMSGYSTSEQRGQAMKLGAYACLQKPFQAEDISRLIGEVTTK